jgi:hypothetical protein
VCETGVTALKSLGQGRRWPDASNRQTEPMVAHFLRLRTNYQSLIRKCSRVAQLEFLLKATLIHTASTMPSVRWFKVLLTIYRRKR